MIVAVAEDDFVHIGVFVLTGLRLLVERVVVGVRVLVFLSISLVVVGVVTIFKDAVGREVVTSLTLQPARTNIVRIENAVKFRKNLFRLYITFLNTEKGSQPAYWSSRMPILGKEACF